MSGKFEPKVPVHLDPPKDDPISLDELSKARDKCSLEEMDPELTPRNTGEDGGKCYVAIKGKVYDVTGNKAYQPGGSYHGHDASKALGKTSTKAEDVSPDWKELDDKEQSTLNDWVTFFSKRYNVVGIVEGATNME